MTAQHTPEIVARIREAGGIVHSDGNIFFTNLAQFLDASGGDGRDAEPVGYFSINDYGLWEQEETPSKSAIPLYAVQPPQDERGHPVALTDEQIEDIYRHAQWDWGGKGDVDAFFLKFARKIERWVLAAQQPVAPVSAAEALLTEIRTALNASGVWHLGMDTVDVIKSLIAFRDAMAPRQQSKGGSNHV